MLPERITIKFFADNADALQLEAFVPIFHGWIRERTVPGLLIDVADYKHVPNAPALQLQGHDGDYYADWTNGRFGLLYRHKREWASGRVGERIALTWERALQAVDALQQEGSLAALSFRTDEIEIAFPDRLNVPNTPETFEALRGELTAVFQTLTGDPTISLTHVHGEKRRPLTIRVAIPLAPPLEALLARGVAQPV